VVDDDRRAPAANGESRERQARKRITERIPHCLGHVCDRVERGGRSEDDVVVLAAHEGDP
jgi:hypothetical protein